MRTIEQVSCSLNLGLIYSVNYSWSPKDGCSISIFFVKEDGTYQKPTYMQKAFIRLGPASFSMYVVGSKISLASGRRVIEVSFQDDLFLLDNYLVVLTGRGCGFNVYPLGRPVDSRTPAQKQADALDPTAQQIAEFTQFPDIQYSFNDFLAILRTKFTVQVLSAFDTTVTNTYTGTFRDVLDSWCSFFNLSYFFENGIIKIFNPVTLHINLPAQPIDAIEYEDEEDARDTYGKTCFNWFQQEGGQFSLNQTSDENGALLVRGETLFPVGYEFNLPQINIDLNQVAAAQYGEQFWFLYNYVRGSTAAECGWNPLTATTSLQASVISSLGTIGARAVLQDNNVYQNRFEAYRTYGQTLAGRWYLSNRVESLAIDKNYTWFDESEGAILNFTNVDDKSMNLEFLTPVGDGINIIPGTTINQFYSGVNYVGNRMAYRDDTPIGGTFNLGSLPVAQIYEQIVDVGGGSSFDFSAFATVATGANVVLAYNPNIIVPQSITALINDIPNQTDVFAPRFTSVPIKGITQLDYSTLKSSQNQPDDVDIITDNSGPNVTSNTAIIKTLKDGAYTVYYDKYAKCSAAHSTGPYYGHRFDPRQISSDTALSFSFSKDANNTYTLERDYATINALVNNPLLPTLAQPRPFTTRRISFTLNYFRTVPVNFLTNGLVGMTVSVAGDGILCSYTFSNEVLTVPYPEERYNLLDQQIRNSWIRQYRPNQVIT